MTDYIEGFGKLSDTVKLIDGADYSNLVLNAQEGFVLSRIDGTLSVSLLCEMTGLGREPTLDVLKSLYAKGVIAVGDQQVSKAKKTDQPDGSSRTANRSTSSTKRPPVASKRKKETEQAAAKKNEGIDPWLEVLFDQEDEEGVNLKKDIRVELRRLDGKLDKISFFELLGVEFDASVKEIRRSYFKASKRYHPDRYYTKNLGPYKEILARVFKQITSAYEYLQDDKKRNDYAQMIQNAKESVTSSTPALVNEPTPVFGARSDSSNEHPQATVLNTDEMLAGEDPLENQPTSVMNRREYDMGSRDPSFTTGPAFRAISKIDTMVDETPKGRSETGGYSYVRRSKSSISGSQRAVSSEQKAIDTFSRPSSSNNVSVNRGSTLDSPAVGKPKTPISTSTNQSLSRHDLESLDDDARAQRRLTDRKRRSQMVAVNPVLDRKRKAATFYEKGLAQFEAGKSLAAAASLKLAMTYDESEPKYAELYNKAVDDSRAHTADDYFKRALFEESVGRYDAANRLFQKAADIFPKGSYLQRAADAMISAGDLAKAKEYGTHAVQIDPNSVEARRVLAEVYLALGLKKNARREVDMALKIDSGNAEIKELLKRIKKS